MKSSFSWDSQRVREKLSSENCDVSIRVRAKRPESNCKWAESASVFKLTIFRSPSAKKCIDFLMRKKFHLLEKHTFISHIERRRCVFYHDRSFLTATFSIFLYLVRNSFYLTLQTLTCVLYWCNTSQQSSLTEKWASTCGKATTSSSHEGLFKYVVYKQPLSLDRFYIHDVSHSEGAGMCQTKKESLYILLLLLLCAWWHKILIYRSFSHSFFTYITFYFRSFFFFSNSKQFEVCVCIGMFKSFSADYHLSHISST